MTFNFVCDRIVRDRAYPALAQHQAEPYTPGWHEFVHKWPFTTPCELIDHCREFAVPYQVWTVDQDFPADSFYPVGLGFFDFNIDYFALMADAIHDALKDQRMRILFYYHEGDNPFKIRERLDSLCLAWQLPENCYRFISGNTAAKRIDNFIYFPDHELLYWRRNKNTPPTPIHTRTRGRDFTVLSRTHKWWRATAIADLKRAGLLDNSYWSYNTQVTIDDAEKDNPIEIDTLEIRTDLMEFLKSGPYRCDTMTDSEHNDHTIVETAHYTNSYCNIVLETHFDADQSGGAFLTEKTFKAIKHGQPFIIAGPAGSLQTLRSLGYRTFDHAIDNTYDTIENNTLRWQYIRDAVSELKRNDLEKFFYLCWADVEHNQRLFQATKADRLNTLLNRLHTL
jgi:hypothetical protein